MSIADKLTQLTTIRGNIRTALTAKDISASDHNFADFATDIDNISSGGGGIEITPYASSSTRYVAASVYDYSSPLYSTYFYDFGASIRFACLIKKQRGSPRFRVAFCDNDPSQSGTTAAVLTDGTGVGDDDTTNLIKFFGSDAFPNSYKKTARYLAVTVHNASTTEPAPTVILFKES